MYTYIHMYIIYVKEIGVAKVVYALPSTTHIFYFFYI